jgi:hypothetical protein
MTDHLPTTPVNPHDRRFAINSGDEKIAGLRAKVAECLQPPVNPKAAEFWNEILADHIRNQHRERIGAECHIQRWKRDATEHVVTIVTEEAA